MKRISKNSKKGRGFLLRYEKASAICVAEVYKNPSLNKRMADFKCYSLFQAEDGRRYRIISHNTFAFTAAWTVPQGLRVETYGASYIITD